MNQFKVGHQVLLQQVPPRQLLVQPRLHHQPLPRHLVPVPPRVQLAAHLQPQQPLQLLRLLLQVLQVRQQVQRVRQVQRQQLPNYEIRLVK